MSHLVLYRNFRPKTFDEVIGQDHIVKTLTSQVENKSFGHAYLFCGTRGTGKTSCAKIFARAVNCENPINGNSCGKCKSCLSNENGGNLDIVEIDAASNNRVDEIRDLREKIGYLPSVNKYKVYIVDEVHMLTDSAFNALLKTLEEPPEHVIFILATTEPHKLPATILSRCMRFDFRLVSDEDLIKHLKFIFDKLSIKYDEESLKLIASSGEGSVRDTLSIAEMCVAYCNSNLTYEKCLSCLGATESETIVSIVNSIASKDSKTILETLNKLEKSGKNFGVITKDLLKAVNNILTIKLTENANEILKLPKELFTSFEMLSKAFTSTRLLTIMRKLNELDYNMKLSSNIYMLFETTILSILLGENEFEMLEQRVEELEKKTINDGYNKSEKIENIIVENTAIDEQKAEEKLTNIVENKTSESTEKSGENANKLCGELLTYLRKNNYQLLYQMMGEVKKAKVENDKFVLEVSKQGFEPLKSNLRTLQTIFKNIDSEKEIVISESDEKVEKPIEEFLKEKFENRLKINK
ncbi:MAG: DNA polymerase III subunit gamma/tau, partial [Clostridiales bacterium]|nr:DNA polymerase III subunit gamma/tau [Candidatus Apopatousia equi]